MKMKKIWDKLGIALSSACVVHCLGVAFFPFFFPALKAFFHSSWVHISMGVIILLTSPLAFIPGHKRHGLTWIMGLAIFGLSLILLGILLEGAIDDLASHAVSILGSLLLVFAHAKNLTHSKHHHCC